MKQYTINRIKQTIGRFITIIVVIFLVEYAIMRDFQCNVGRLLPASHPPYQWWQRMDCTQSAGNSLHLSLGAILAGFVIVAFAIRFLESKRNTLLQ